MSDDTPDRAADYYCGGSKDDIGSLHGPHPAPQFNGRPPKWCHGDPNRRRDSARADVAALRAENERLRDQWIKRGDTLVDVVSENMQQHWENERLRAVVAKVERLCDEAWDDDDGEDAPVPVADLRAALAPSGTDPDGLDPRLCGGDLSLCAAQGCLDEACMTRPAERAAALLRTSQHLLEGETT